MSTIEETEKQLEIEVGELEKSLDRVREALRRVRLSRDFAEKPASIYMTPEGCARMDMLNRRDDGWRDL